MISLVTWPKAAFSFCNLYTPLANLSILLLDNCLPLLFVKQFHQNYGYDLNTALAKHPIKELDNEQDKARLLESLHKGNRQSVTFLHNGNEQKQFIEANPQFKSINIYDENMQRMGSRQAKDEKQAQGESKTVKQDSKKEVQGVDKADPDVRAKKRDARKANLSLDYQCALKLQCCMDTLKPLSDFFLAIEKDPRISITHIGIYAALLQYWKEHQYENPMQAFSHEIMRIAKISASATYHKCIRDLSEFGYIRYEPSFKRNQGSKVYFPMLKDLQ